MVLAFMAKGVKEVAKLGVLLEVNLNGLSGTEYSFYVRNDSTAWESRFAHKCCHIEGHIPETKVLPGTTLVSGTSVRLEATLHPRLTDWSNALCQSTYAQRPERPLVEEVLGVIFGHVLRIDRKKRMSASALKVILESIQKE